MRTGGKPFSGMRRLLVITICMALAGAGAEAQERPMKRAMGFRATTVEDARKWQAECREKLFALMMGGGKPARVPPDVKVLQRTDVPHANYALEEITIQTRPDRRAHCWMAIPKSPKGRVGGILAIHGHGGSGEQVVKGEGLYWYGRHLAERGYVVIAPDVGSHDLQHPDWTLMGERVWDCLCAVDYLASRPEVDPKRLAVCGLSLGGETTMYVGALDERLKVVCSSGWLTTVQNMKEIHCPCWNFPGLEENFEFADIFSCTAPRYLICENGEQEPGKGGFPVEIAKGAFQEIRRAYKVFGAEDRLEHDIHPGGHIFSGRLILKRLDKALGTPR